MTDPPAFETKASILIPSSVPQPLRILCLLSKSPLPDYTGSRRRLRRLVEAAGRNNEVHVVVVSSDVSNQERTLLIADAQLSVPVQIVDVVRRRPNLRQVYRWLAQAEVTFEWLNRDAEAARCQVERIVELIKPDLMWVDNAILADAVVPAGCSVALAIDMAHDERTSLDSQLRSALRYPRSAQSTWKRLALLTLNRRSRLSAERRGLDRALLVTPCSDVEAGVANRSTLGEIHIIRNGVDVPQWTEGAPATRRLLFVANLDYAPNQEAARSLIVEILPALRRIDPSICLDIVGPGTLRIPNLGSRPWVEVHGFVEDLASVYARAQLVVAPIWSGSGTKLKVLEAFAYGTPVVTTPGGLAGLDARPGHEVALGTSTTELVEAALRLLENPELARLQREAARAWVVDTYSWVTIGERFGSVLRGHGDRRWGE